jgi:hypothetical protein
MIIFFIFFLDLQNAGQEGRCLADKKRTGVNVEKTFFSVSGDLAK